MYIQVAGRMLSPADAWTKEYNEALKLADTINNMVSAASCFPPTGQQTHRHFATTRRKIAILKTKLGTLEILMSHIPCTTQAMTNKRMDMLESVRSKADEMADTLNSCCPARKDRLIDRTEGMDNHGVVTFQKQIMNEQDLELGKLEEAVVSTKYIALTINEELDLQTKLLDKLDDHVETTGFRLQWVRMKLGFFSERTKGGFWCLGLAALAIVILTIIIVAILKYL